MIGELTAAEIERILTDGHIGRLGVTDGEQIYIFPVSYGYDGTAAYLVSRLGLKVRLMRAHPEVCFEVEEIDTPAHWRTVMAHGRYEELIERDERDAAFALIAGQGQAVTPPSLAPYVDGPEVVVVYRIWFHTKTGRFEQDEVFGNHAAYQQPLGGHAH